MAIASVQPDSSTTSVVALLDLASSPEIQTCLEKILASRGFAQSKSVCRFLRYVVDRSMEGAQDQLKEYTIGVQVYDRGADFDPRLDPIVRVQAGKLRARLEEYYHDFGSDDAVRIELPKGGYVPVFQLRSHAEPCPRAHRTLPLAKTVVCGVLAVLCTGAVGYWLGARFGASAEKRVVVDAVSLAVQPFADISGTAETAQLAAKLAAEVPALLRTTEGLHLVTVPAPRGYLLKGYVRQLGARVFIRAELHRTGEGAPHWTGNYSRETGNLDGIVKHVAQAVAARVSGLLVKHESD